MKVFIFLDSRVKDCICLVFKNSVILDLCIEICALFKISVEYYVSCMRTEACIKIHKVS